MVHVLSNDARPIPESDGEDSCTRNCVRRSLRVPPKKETAFTRLKIKYKMIVKIQRDCAWSLWDRYVEMHQVRYSTSRLFTKQSNGWIGGGWALIEQSIFCF
mmetsp:Transcript_7540/g.14742  ORF Transcript_7540/g.14742 Transcript_7540/m.14742 type:complete len:102 (-) Transcript_7540:1272-1577(-)